MITTEVVTDMDIDAYDPVLTGTRIKRQREYLGLSRADLAEESSISERYCYDIELGLKNASMEVFCNLAKHLNLSMDYMLFGRSNNGKYETLISLIKTCPEEKISYLEEIVSAYIKSLT